MSIEFVNKTKVGFEALADCVKMQSATTSHRHAQKCARTGVSQLNRLEQCLDFRRSKT